MGLLSIIVAIYNTEKYLVKCCDSLKNQTFHDLEIILVDDGSTDSSATICDKYAKEDKRFHVVHKKNGGLPTAAPPGSSTCSAAPSPAPAARAASCRPMNAPCWPAWRGPASGSPTQPSCCCCARATRTPSTRATWACC